MRSYKFIVFIILLALTIDSCKYKQEENDQNNNKSGNSILSSKQTNDQNVKITGTTLNFTKLIVTKRNGVESFDINSKIVYNDKNFEVSSTQSSSYLPIYLNVKSINKTDKGVTILINDNLKIKSVFIKADLSEAEIISNKFPSNAPKNAITGIALKK